VDGVIWGRGALDDKSGVLGILEAATYLLEAGHQPVRTVYLSFGHDEEIGGPEGAAAVAAYLADQGVQLAWSLDEGSFIFDGLIDGVDSLVAAINVAEKGSVTLDIIAAAEGGHSSMPPKTSAITDLARAITRLEENPVPGGLEGLAADMFDRISRHMPFVPRVFFANQWLFGGLIEEQLSEAPTTNAMLRTTTAPTMLSGSVKTNVLPIEAVATVNFRIHPRDSVESVENYVTDLVASDSISVHSHGGGNPSAVSDWQAPGYEVIAQSMREIHGDIPVAPGLMIAASDSRHYGKVADNAYRFNPIRLTPELLTGFHGTNEKISVTDYAQGVRGYIRIIAQGTAK
jgi:carboxypeptidase PM20D1